jgi:hypothetical protein
LGLPIPNNNKESPKLGKEKERKERTRDEGKKTYHVWDVWDRYCVELATLIRISLTDCKLLIEEKVTHLKGKTIKQ